MQRSAIVLLLLLALPACASGVANNGVADFCDTAFEDATELDEDEFDAGIGDIDAFDAWDDDDDGIIDDEECAMA